RKRLPRRQRDAFGCCYSSSSPLAWSSARCSAVVSCGFSIASGASCVDPNQTKERGMAGPNRGGPNLRSPGRRDFVRGAASLALLSTLPIGRAGGAPPERDGRTGSSSFPGVITRQKDPDNLEFPFPTLNSFLTPNEQFYVRTHFEV